MRSDVTEEGGCDVVVSLTLSSLVGLLTASSPTRYNRALLQRGSKIILYLPVPRPCSPLPEPHP